ncbi:MAG: PTS sugar transporter subunit IIA [Propionibacteriaceae bacterium]|jgi:mannitol/fructose-specific phosphotransferase system IIA component|nr:PTS sugar transporter subunit IIA [Propionibacteriaceae bacterium]
MEILTRSNIVTGCPSTDPESAILRCGRMLVDSGYAKERYITGMLARNRSFSVAIGNLIAIPHGEKEYKDDVIATGLAVLAYPGGIDWGGEPVKLVIGIAAQGDEHLEILARIVEVAEDQEAVDALAKATDAEAIHAAFTQD